MSQTAKQIITIGVAALMAKAADGAKPKAQAPADTSKQTDPKSVAYTGEARRVTVEEPEVSVRPRYERFQAEDGSFVCIDNSNNRQVADDLCHLSGEIWIA